MSFSKSRCKSSFNLECVIWANISKSRCKSSFNLECVIWANNLSYLLAPDIPSVLAVH